MSCCAGARRLRLSERTQTIALTQRSAALGQLHQQSTRGGAVRRGTGRDLAGGSDEGLERRARSGHSQGTASGKGGVGPSGGGGRQTPRDSEIHSQRWPRSGARTDGPGIGRRRTRANPRGRQCRRDRAPGGKGRTHDPGDRALQDAVHDFRGVNIRSRHDVAVRLGRRDAPRRRGLDRWNVHVRGHGRAAEYAPRRRCRRVRLVRRTGARVPASPGQPDSRVDRCERRRSGAEPVRCHWQGRRGRGHRLGRAAEQGADRNTNPRVRRLRRRADAALRRLRPRHARRAHHCGQRVALARAV